MEDEIKHYLQIGAAWTMNNDSSQRIVDTVKEIRLLEFGGVRLLLVLKIRHIISFKDGYKHISPFVTLHLQNPIELYRNSSNPESLFKISKKNS